MEAQDSGSSPSGRATDGAERRAAKNECEAEAVGPTGGKRSEGTGPRHHGEGEHLENRNGPSPEIRPKKITSTKLGAYLFGKFPGWDFDGKLFGGNFNADNFSESLRAGIDFENAEFAMCSNELASDDFGKKKSGNALGSLKLLIFNS